MTDKERKPEELTAQDADLRGKIRTMRASSDEEVDALKVNLHQDLESPGQCNGTGKVVDELAEEKLAEFTEMGPLAGERGAESLTPGRDDTSSVIRMHHPNTSLARAQDVVEGNLDEPMNQTVEERKVDEGTAA